MGIFDFLDERFDLDGDGEISAAESFLAYKEYEYATGDYGDSDDGEDF